MSATTPGDPFVPAEPPRRGRSPDPPSPEDQARRAAARAERHKLIAERALRWKAITDAGGPEPWIAAQLAAQGLSGAEPTDKAALKERKKAEAAARRALRRQVWEAWHATHIHHLGSGVHWDELADPDPLDVPDRAQRAAGLGLPALQTADDLAAALGTTISQLRWLTYHREVDRGTHYRRWTIAKRDGRRRTITAPKVQLKAAQRWALRQVFERLPLHGAAHGFLAGRSIASNARVHAGADVIVKLDIQDFFPTVTWRRVKGLLRKHGVAEQPATLLALLCTEPPRDPIEHRGETHWVATGPRTLPQGAPTSPAITNAICLRLDRRMAALGRKLGFKYTRYADDLVFSWRKPAEATDDKRRRPAIGALIAGARAVLRSEGFAINPNKTAVLGRGTRQMITGLVVNPAPGAAPARVPREVLRRLRAALHNREHGKPGKEGETIEQLRGMAAFVHMTDPARGRALLDRIEAIAAREP